MQTADIMLFPLSSKQDWQKPPKSLKKQPSSGLSNKLFGRQGGLMVSALDSRDPFLERPGNLRGPKSYFEIKVSRKVGCVLISNIVYFVSLADNFTV